MVDIKTINVDNIKALIEKRKQQKLRRADDLMLIGTVDAIKYQEQLLSQANELDQLVRLISSPIEFNDCWNSMLEDEEFERKMSL